MGSLRPLNIKRIAATVGFAAIFAHAQTLTTLATFNGTNGFLFDNAALTEGSDGNFYGVSYWGGSGSCPSPGCGTVFQVTPTGTLTTLHSFQGTDGQLPVAGLIQGSDGNFYGTTSLGGAHGEGTVFKISSSGAFAVLHNFAGTDGRYPLGLVAGNSGDLYGVATGGEGFPCMVFKITPDGTFATIYTFPGTNVTSGLMLASDGNFYGTTTSGSQTLFRLTPDGAYTTVYDFGANFNISGDGPIGPLLQGPDGQIYGTNQFSAPIGTGTFYKITLNGQLTVLYNFDSPNQNTYPLLGLVQSIDGSFYLATGGQSGQLIKFTPPATITTLFTFPGNANYGTPLYSLTQASDGSFYGTTGLGPEDQGTIVRLTIGAAPIISETNGVVSGASFGAGMVSNCWMSIYGVNLSPVTGTWDGAISNGVLPTKLNGVGVTVGGVPAYIAYVSPTQINIVTPEITVLPAPVVVTNANGTSPPVSAGGRSAQPAFFQWGNYVVATSLSYAPVVKNGTLAGVTTTPARPGDTIILWGTGFGPTMPDTPIGVEVPLSPTYVVEYPVAVDIGPVQAQVLGAALAPGFAGLYQIAIQIPTSLGAGDYPIVAIVTGNSSPQTFITIQ